MTITAFPNGVSSFGNVLGPGFGFGIGNVYFVCQTTNTVVYADMVLKYGGQTYDNDGSAILHTTIASALTATVEARDDYVIICSDNADYDITAVLTMNKKSVHLIAPGGLGHPRGAMNAVRVHQNTAATDILALSDACIEIAGFYFKPYIGVTHIGVAAGTYAPNVHHNTFNLQTTSSNESIIDCAGDGGAYGYVAHHCRFESGGGDDQTTAAMISVGSTATCARVDYNDFFVGDGNVYTVVIKNLATKGSVNYNTFMAAGSDATMTHCIQIGDYGCAVGNRGAVGDGTIIVGGVSDVTNVDNMNAIDGGTIDDHD